MAQKKARPQKPKRGPAKRAIISMVQAATGVAAREKSDHVYTASRLLQALINGESATQFKEEYERAKADGRIHDSFSNSKEAGEILFEMFAFVDRADPDKITFDFMKKLFFSIATSTSIEKDRMLVREMLRIARQLTYPEVAVITACGRLVASGIAQKALIFEDWARRIAEDSSLQHEHLVHRAHNRLVDFGIVYPVTHGEIQTSMGGLTSLGLQIYRRFSINGGSEVAI